MRDFLDKVGALQRSGEAFATATVVGRRPPVSAHLGDRAIVYGDGRMEGFVGGACSREIVRKQALECIRTRRPRLVSISPDPAAASASDAEHVIVPMTCVSEGAVDVYIEPGVQPRRLVVVGATPVADALTRTALTLDYEVVRVVDAHEQQDLERESASPGVVVASLDALESLVEGARQSAAVVVASQGHYDEQALETVLRAGASYVALLASRTRGAAIKEWLAEKGVPGVESIRNPAGLDLGARTAPEVALSILAEIVQSRPTYSLQTQSDPVAQPIVQPAESDFAVDPVCNMDVEIATARHIANVDDTAYYFCCERCRTRFLSDPASFLAARR
jgi:xanthine dehydrogenase accessory factor